MLRRVPGSTKINPARCNLIEGISLKSLGEVGMVERAKFFDHRIKRAHNVSLFSPAVKEMIEAQSFSLETDQVTNLCYYELLEPQSTVECEMLVEPSEDGRFTSAQILCLAANIALNGGDFLSTNTRNLFFLTRTICVITRREGAWSEGDSWSVYDVPGLIHMEWMKGDRVYRPASHLAPKIMSADEVAEMQRSLDEFYNKVDS